ncbi:hypothetical protein [Streptomyces sp. NPDC048665]|uniref:hypothetical protein n=1 Tax=Streptomyces sp. NPDC048665 TaxID=3155490 RepID=UPI00341A6E8F
MPEPRSGRTLAAHPAKAVQPAVGTRQRRLAARLADMVPGASIIRVSQRGPGQTWPSPYSRAYDEQGRLITLNRAQGLTAARWVIRANSDVNWDEAYLLDLTTGVLRPAAESYAASGGGH